SLDWIWVMGLPSQRGVDPGGPAVPGTGRSVALLPRGTGARVLQRLERGTVPVADSRTIEMDPRRTVDPVVSILLARDRRPQQRRHLLATHAEREAGGRVRHGFPFVFCNPGNLQAES